MKYWLLLGLLGFCAKPLFADICFVADASDKEDLVIAEYWTRIEDAFKRPLHEVVDCFAGVANNAVPIALVATPANDGKPYRGKDIAEILNTGIDDVFHSLFGYLKLSNALKPIKMWALDQETSLVTFDSTKLEWWSDFYVKWVVQASLALRHEFEPFKLPYLGALRGAEYTMDPHEELIADLEKKDGQHTIYSFAGSAVPWTKQKRAKFEDEKRKVRVVRIEESKDKDEFEKRFVDMISHLAKR